MRPKNPKSPDALGKTYHPGEPLPAAEVVENDSHSAWALFQAMQDGTHDGFPTTTRSTLEDCVANEPRQLKPLTADEVLYEARRNNRVCPMPSHWQKLHELLAQLTGAQPPAPVSVTEWRSTPPQNKRTRLRPQVVWAAEYKMLDPLFAFLRELPEDKWFHMGG
jgi:hypothetical protein